MHLVHRNSEHHRNSATHRRVHNCVVTNWSRKQSIILLFTLFLLSTKSIHMYAMMTLTIWSYLTNFPRIFHIAQCHHQYHPNRHRRRRRRCRAPAVITRQHARNSHYIISKWHETMPANENVKHAHTNSRKIPWQTFTQQRVYRVRMEMDELKRKESCYWCSVVKAVASNMMISNMLTCRRRLIRLRNCNNNHTFHVSRIISLGVRGRDRARER